MSADEKPIRLYVGGSNTAVDRVCRSFFRHRGIRYRKVPLSTFDMEHPTLVVLFGSVTGSAKVAKLFRRRWEHRDMTIVLPDWVNRGWRLNVYLHGGLQDAAKHRQERTSLFLSGRRRINRQQRRQLLQFLREVYDRSSQHFERREP